MLFVALLLVSAAACAGLVRAKELPCSQSGLVTSCNVTFPDRLVVDGDSVYVGLEDKLVHFNLDLIPRQSVNREASSEVINKCRDFRQPECGNYILTMLITNLQDNSDIASRPEYLPLVNKTVLFICSTFSFSPQCQLCDANNISHCVNTSSDIKNGYSPYDRRFSNVYTLTKENYFYTGSTFNDKNGLQAIAKSSNPFMGAKFTLHTQTSPTWRWLFHPVFISLYEVDQYIYFFWREEAFEADMYRRMYTRVGRVCKSDRGLGNDKPTVVSTFAKARMLCSVPANSQNRYPFEYNELVATHLSTDGSSPILYAVFSTPSNGPNSSAICTFKFDNTDNSLTSVFKGDYLFSDSGREDADWSTVPNPVPFDCPGEGNNQRDTEAAHNYLLMKNPVSQSSTQPIYIEDGTRITAMAVDLVPQEGNSSIEVLYIGLNNGVVKAVLQGVTKTLLLYTIPSGEPVDKIVLHEKDGVKYCYVTSAKNVAVIQLGKCHEHETCSKCADDIYCKWDGQSCANEISNSHVTCPPTPSMTTTTSTTTTTTISSAAPVVITSYKTVCSPPVVLGTLCSNKKTDTNSSIVAGAAVGGVALGFIIAVIVFLTAYFIKKSHSSKESAVNPTSPSKEDLGDPFDFPVTKTEQNHHINGFNHHPALPTHMTRARTESTKRLMSVTSDYPDSPSPTGTLPLPSRHE